MRGKLTMDDLIKAVEEVKRTDELKKMAYQINCPICDNEKCVRNTEQCEAARWWAKKRFRKGE